MWFQQLRKLTDSDVSHVFQRIVRGVPEKDLLLLGSIGPSSPNSPTIASFITFQLDGVKITHMGETGYLNSACYRPVSGIPSSIIEELQRRHEDIVKERLRRIARSVEEFRAEQKRIHDLCGHPESWRLIHSSLLSKHSNVTVFIWREPNGPWRVDLCYSGKIIASRPAQSSAVPDADIGGIDFRPIVNDLCRTGGVIELILSEPNIAAQITQK